MSETTMPAIEADIAVDYDEERGSYELAFHVLPTVAEGEVSGVYEALKTIITKEGGTLFDEEEPERFDLAYELVKHIEGKNRKFRSAYFGWVRFKAPATAVSKMSADIESHKDVLRSLLIKLTKVEEAHPFRFHDAVRGEKMVTNIEEPEALIAKDESSDAIIAETDAAPEKDEKATDEASPEEKA